MSGGDSVLERRLARGASGLRHLRWVREVLGTMVGVAAHEGALSERQRAVLRDEIDVVTGLVDRLSAAVKPYRDFLERVRTRARGAVRAAELLSRGADASAGVAGGRGESAGVAEAHRESSIGGSEISVGTAEIEAARAELQVVEGRRAELREGLSGAIDDVREALARVEERLCEVFPREMVEGLYPALTADRMRVLDDGDADDDSAGG